jgi:hypothetical protein
VISPGNAADAPEPSHRVSFFFLPGINIFGTKR